MNAKALFRAAKYGNVAPVQADLCALPIRDGSIDIVLATSSLPLWAKSVTQIDTFYSECRRVVKVRGLLSIFPVCTNHTDDPESFHERSVAASRNVRSLHNAKDYITMGNDFELVTAKRIK